jgi:hypothetical protein
MSFKKKDEENKKQTLNHLLICAYCTQPFIATINNIFFLLKIMTKEKDMLFNLSVSFCFRLVLAGLAYSL